MPRKTSRTIYAILGGLEKGPKTGYDLKKMLEQVRYQFWNESYGQIYPTLRKLVSNEWATMEVEEQEGAPDKKIYTITDEGRAELERWLRQPASDFSMRDEVVLRLDLGANASPAFLQGMLELLVDQCNDRLETLESELDDQEQDINTFEQMSAEWTRAYLEARREWAGGCIERIAAMHSH